MSWPTSAAPTLHGPEHISRALSRALLCDASAASRLRQVYDEQALAWAAWIDSQPDYFAPITDAIGRCPELLSRPRSALEVSAGSRSLMGWLTFDHAVPKIVSDASWEMLSRSGEHPFTRVVAEVQRLPFRTDSIGLLVGLNAVACWSELRRVLGPRGRLLWASSFGDDTPLYTPLEDILRAFPQRTVVTAKAGHGNWVAVLAPGDRE